MGPINKLVVGVLWLLVLHKITSGPFPVLEGEREGQIRALQLCAAHIKNRWSLQSIHPGATTNPGLSVITALLLISGNIQPNPGPQESTIYPCGFCNLKVDWSHQALCCDNCDV